MAIFWKHLKKVKPNQKPKDVTFITAKLQVFSYWDNSLIKTIKSLSDWDNNFMVGGRFFPWMSLKKICHLSSLGSL